jgi:hypothetical protein
VRKPRNVEARMSCSPVIDPRSFLCVLNVEKIRSPKPVGTRKKSGAMNASLIKD